MNKIVIQIAVILILLSSSLAYAQSPMTKVDSTMSWYKNAKFGMFIHFDVKGDNSEFNPQNLDMDEWVRIARQAGIKYIVPTTHQVSHIIMWDSRLSLMDVTDVTPFRQDYLKKDTKTERSNASAPT